MMSLTYMQSKQDSSTYLRGSGLRVLMICRSVLKDNDFQFIVSSRARIDPSAASSSYSYFTSESGSEDAACIFIYGTHSLIRKFVVFVIPFTIVPSMTVIALPGELLLTDLLL